MLTAQEIVLEYLFPALGMITANIMFAAPLRDVYRATQKGDLGSLNPTPWAVMLGNCFGWVTYSFLIENYFVFFANAPGFILSIYFNIQTFKLQSIQRHTKSIRQSLLLAQPNCILPIRIDGGEGDDTNELQHCIDDNNNEKRVLEAAAATPPMDVPNNDAKDDDDDNQNNNTAVIREYANIFWNATAQNIPAPFVGHDYLVLGFIILWLVVVTIVVFGTTQAPTVFTSQVNELVVGIVGNCNLLFFYGAPLSTILTVLKTKSSATIHIPTILTNTLNSVFWFAFGVGVADWFIAVPNGLGALLGSIEITLCVIFPRKKPAPTNEDTSEGHDNDASNVIGNTNLGNEHECCDKDGGSKIEVEGGTETATTTTTTTAVEISVTGKRHDHDPMMDHDP